MRVRWSTSSYEERNPFSDTSLRYCQALSQRNISSLHLEFLWQPGKNQKKIVVFPERREGGTVDLTERSEVKTVPPERREGKTFF